MPMSDLLHAIKKFTALSNLEPENISKDPVVLAKIGKIKLQASMPLSGEQVLRILIELFSLKYDCRVESLGSGVDLNNPAYISSLAQSVLPLLEREKDGELYNKFAQPIHDLTLNSRSEKDVYTELKTLFESNISCIDIDFVMQAASHARKVRTTRNKNAILVLGKTGVGKSFVINYIGCETMFTRGLKMFGHKLDVNLSKQPDYLKQIKIGQSVVSETSEMGVLDVDQITTKSLRKFHGQGYIVCDTPGAADNRNLGDEIKLANTLETIAPMYKAASVRFLVLLSAKATSARGEEFRETIKHIARMFTNVAALEAALDAMIVAVNGEEAKENLPDFVRQINEFYESRFTLGFNDKEIKLIQGFIEKFTKHEVLLIAPGKDATVNPEQLLTAITNRKPADPKILIPFAEPGIGHRIEQEMVLLAKSMEKILNSLEHDLPNDVLKNEIQRLAIKFAKLSFMDSYYSVNKSNVVPFFKKLADLMTRMRRSVLDIVCPTVGEIDLTKVTIAKNTRDGLSDLDDMVRSLVNGVFANNRERVCSLIASFDHGVKFPENYATINDDEWNDWLDQYRPKPMTEVLDYEVKQYRLAQNNRFKALLELIHAEIRLQQVQRMSELNMLTLEQVPQANMLRLQTRHRALSEYTRKVSEQLCITMVIDDWTEHCSHVVESHNEKLHQHSAVNADLMRVLSDVRNNIEVHVNLETSDVNDGLTTETATLIPSEYKRHLNLLVGCAYLAIDANDYAAAMSAISRSEELCREFGDAPDYEAVKIKGKLSESISDFVDATIDILDGNAGHILNENAVAELIVRMFVIQTFINHDSHEQYLEATSLYPSSLGMRLSRLDSSVVTHFMSHRAAIDTIFMNGYGESEFNQLSQNIQQLWNLLSFPMSCRAELVENYADVVRRVTTYCTTVGGHFSGLLQNESSVTDYTYTKIKNYLQQLQKYNWVSVLNLGHVQENLIKAINLRATKLVEKLDLVDVSPGMDINLVNSDESVNEVQQLATICADVIPAELHSELTRCVAEYHGKINITLDTIDAGLKPDSPFEYFISAYKYTTQCIRLGACRERAKSVHNSITGYAKESIIALNADFDRDIIALSPVNGNDNEPIVRIQNLLADIMHIKQQAPDLYSALGDPIRVVSEKLADLALSYQEALISALRHATIGGSLEQGSTVLLARVTELQVFDDYIKQFTQGTSKPVTFKRLFKRFENAFKADHFPKIRNAMRAVYDGDFDSVQNIVSENKQDLVPGSDVYQVMTDQIATYIGATVTTIRRSVTQLREHPVSNPAFMKELMQSYARIAEAHKLVEAGVLSRDILADREHLLIETQNALDTWLISVVNQVDTNLQAHNFLTATKIIKDLRNNVSSIAIKPVNYKKLLTASISKLKSTLDQCEQQYTQPLNQWREHPISLDVISSAFAAVMDVEFDSVDFSDKWKRISKRVYQAIDTRCTYLENEFNSGKIGVEAAVLALEEIQAITVNVKPDVTDLVVRIKERYQRTVIQIQKDNLNDREEKVRLDNIQSLLAASERFAKSLGVFDLTVVSGFISGQAKNLKTAIMLAFRENRIPHDELIYFSDFYRRFSPQFDLLVRDHELYSRLIEVVITGAFTEINESAARYAGGIDQHHSLQSIHTSLLQLIEIQRVATATQGRAGFVDNELPNKVVSLLLGLKDLLVANYGRFKSAMEGRSVADLDQVFVTASAFKDMSNDIEKYIHACAISPLPEEFRNLVELNNNYSVEGLRNELVAGIKAIRSDLIALKPKTLKSEGVALREDFYSKLRRDVEFIQSLKRLSAHVPAEVLVAKSLSEDFGLHDCLDAVTEFLAETFRLAHNQLKTVSVPNVANNWIEFNRYYQELTIFVEQCEGSEKLGGLRIPKQLLLPKKEDEGYETANSISSGGIFGTIGSYFSGHSATPESSSISASLVVKFLATSFDKYLSGVIDNFIKQHFVRPRPDNFDTELVSILSGLQKMAEDMPVLADNVTAAVRQFLAKVQDRESVNYMAHLAELLRSEEQGFGARMVAGQPVFSGMMTSERNKLTMNQDIEYVLEHTEVLDKASGKARSLYDYEKHRLRCLYQEFDDVYQDSIATYTAPDKDFSNHRQVHLENLRDDLLDLVSNIDTDVDDDGHLIWNDKIIDAIPLIYSYLFTIWTLNESQGFFDDTNVDASTSFLKKPHPAQMVAIFQMLNMLDTRSNVLPRQLDEVLTGQGKSVVLASTASLLALLGFAVDLGCYSEYLSGRDEKGFEWMFELLGIRQYIKYGTFNRLSEDMLNQDGDLRDLMRNALFGTDIEIDARPDHGRQTIALVDEVDSLVTAFFGHMYQPYFLLQEDLILRLIDAVWTRHENGTMKKFDDLLNLPEYQACLKHYAGLEYLIENSAKEMFADLKRYKRDQGHDFHVNSQGDIYYKHFDGTSMSKSIGYRTLWACMDKSNNVRKACRDSNKGLKVTCGAFSYADLMCDHSRYRSILGVTGTFRELSKAEKGVVKDVFGIQGASFIPSAYGDNKLQFNPGTQVKLVADDEYELTLLTEITKSKIGWTSGKPIRPVLVFFETEQALEKFYNSANYKDYRADTIKMTSETITTVKERDALINQATRAGQITLAVKDHGRGSDFILSDPQVIANGGMAVIDAFMPETEADQRQHQGRGARQGQDGSFSMVLKQSEIKSTFGLTDSAIAEARRTSRLYEVISEARNNKFSASYQKLVDDAEVVLEKFHKPSMKLLRSVRTSTEREKVIEAHKETIASVNTVPVVVDLKEAKVLILFDSTGSMGHLISALKATLSHVVESLESVLNEAGCQFNLQIAHYEDYYSGPDKALRHTTEWSHDPATLKSFLNPVKADGGGSNKSECVELGLYFANQLVAEGLNHVILIGDEPPSPQSEMNDLRQKYAPSGMTQGSFVQARHYEIEAKSLADSGVPVSTFFIRTGMFNSLRDSSGNYMTQTAFANIAKITGGEAGELKLDNPETAALEVVGLFGRKVIGAATSDSRLAADLYAKFMERTQQFSR